MILPHDPQIVAWLADGPHEGPPESLARALAATHRTRKRPRWTFPERWIPMQLTMTLTRSQRPILAIVMLVLLMVALVASVLVIGALRLQKPTLYRNGAVVYAANKPEAGDAVQDDSDLFIADQLGGTPRALASGPEIDSSPVFSPQGDRIAFIRDGRQIMTVNPDGSDLRPLADLGTVIRLAWSPDASALLASTFSLEHLQALRVVQSDGSGSRTLDLNGIYAVSGSWRPDGRLIAFVGYQAGALATFIADADGTNVRPLGVGPDDWSGGLEWSPDGKQIGFLSPTEEVSAYPAQAGRTIIIADIAEDGAVTDVRQLKLGLDPESIPASDPKWSPDGSQLSFAVTVDAERRKIRVAIADADGSGLRLVGPAFSPRAGLHLVTGWSVIDHRR